MSSEIKFNIGHFPIGSVVEVTVSDREPVIFTVIGFHKNEYNNYIIISDKYNDICKMNNSYHISHVTRIIKRGTGKTFDQIYKEDHCKYSSCSIYSVLNFYIEQMRLLPFNSVIRIDGLIKELINLDIVKESKWGEILKVNKKRLKRYLKQNRNRLLINVKKAQKEADDRWDEINRLDFEQDYEATFDLSDDKASEIERQTKDATNEFVMTSISEFDRRDYDQLLKIGLEEEIDNPFIDEDDKELHDTLIELYTNDGNDEIPVNNDLAQAILSEAEEFIDQKISEIHSVPMVPLMDGDGVLVDTEIPEINSGPMVPFTEDDGQLYTDVPNKYGFTDTVDNQGDIVCSQCHCLKMPNRGNGTMCNECIADDILECQHDMDH